MNNQAPTQQQDEAVITLEGEDGNSYSCQILDIFEFENQEYALLLKMGGEEQPDSVIGSEASPKKAEKAENDDEDEDGTLVIMRLVTRDDQSIFQTIESDDEFDRVVKHVEARAQEAESEEEEVE
jgi:hypothetical protein